MHPELSAIITVWSALCAQSVSALFTREIKRYFGSSIYLFNTGFGAVLLIAGAIYGAFMHSKAQTYIQLMGGMEVVIPIAAIVLGFIVATIDTTCISISMEGKTFWIIKEAPVQPRAYFGAKVLLNLLVSWPATVLSCLILGIAYRASTFDSCRNDCRIAVAGIARAISESLHQPVFPEDGCSQ